MDPFRGYFLGGSRNALGFLAFLVFSGEFPFNPLTVKLLAGI